MSSDGSSRVTPGPDLIPDVEPLLDAEERLDLSWLAFFGFEIDKLHTRGLIADSAGSRRSSLRPATRREVIERHGKAKAHLDAAKRLAVHDGRAALRRSECARTMDPTLRDAWLTSLELLFRLRDDGRATSLCDEAAARFPDFKIRPELAARIDQARRAPLFPSTTRSARPGSPSKRARTIGSSLSLKQSSPNSPTISMHLLSSPSRSVGRDNWSQPSNGIRSSGPCSPRTTSGRSGSDTSRRGSHHSPPALPRSRARSSRVRRAQREEEDRLELARLCREGEAVGVNVCERTVSTRFLRRYIAYDVRRENVSPETTLWSAAAFRRFIATIKREQAPALQRT